MPRHSSLAPPLRSGNVSTGYVRSKPGMPKTPPTPSPLKGEVGGGEHSGNPGPGLLDEIKNLASKLGPAERSKLLAELSLASNDSDIASSRDLDMWTAAVHEGLAEQNGGSSAGLPGPMVVKRALSAAGAWTIVRGFMSAAKLDTLSVAERMGVYRLLAELVIAHAHGVSMRSAAPLTPKLVANCSTNISGIFDKAFPGYVKAGLAPMVARQMSRAA